MPEPRLTLIARDNQKPDIDWNYRPCAEERVTFIVKPAAVQAALWAGADLNLDIARVIVDRASTADQFLELLTNLPRSFTGDALAIRDDGTGVLSATGRGGDRLLYSLTAYDVRFYLEAMNLVTGRVVVERTA